MTKIQKTPEERFWLKVNKASGQGPDGTCWLWTAAIDSSGYGAFNINGKKRNSHRIAYEFANGAIDRNMDIRHHCHIRLCCNPAHLESGSRLENMQDTVKAGNQARGENHGSAKLATKNVIEIKKMLAAGLSAYRVAQIFGLDRKMVQRIKNGETWKHVS